MKQRILSCILAAGCAAAAATAASYSATQLSNTNAVRFSAAPVARVEWIDLRNMLPAGATVAVERVYSTGSDVIATVQCSAGLGRGAPNTNTWFLIRNEYLRYTGATSGVGRVISADTP